MMTLYEPVGISQMLRLLPELLHAVNERYMSRFQNLYVKFSYEQDDD